MKPYGGFEHNLQSLRVVDVLEQRYGAFDGLNLTFETREGILKHCSLKNAHMLGDVGERFIRRQRPGLEAQIANLADEIALGGAEKLLLSYLKNLDKKKYSFYVCCLRDQPDDLSLEISEYAQIINLKMKSKFNPMVVFHLLKVIKSIQPEIIHTHLFQPRIFTTFAHLLYRRGVLITHKHSMVNPRNIIFLCYWK